HAESASPQDRVSSHNEAPACDCASAGAPAIDCIPSTDVIRRHDRNGPRYTSYPTALQFTPGFSAADYEAAVADTNRRQPAAPLSMYLHLPFCASPCFYCACTKIITRQQSVAEAYLSRLEREIEMQGRLFPIPRVVEQLHFGGGTPTFYSSERLGH